MITGDASLAFSNARGLRVLLNVWRRINRRYYLIAVLLWAIAPTARAEPPNDIDALQSQIEEVLLDSLGNRLDPQDWQTLQKADLVFKTDLQSTRARSFWQNASVPLREMEPTDPRRVAELCGYWQGALQHTLAFEMLDRLRAGQLLEAQNWRALITLPKHANSIEGALALQRMGGDRGQQEAVGRLLAHEYLSWQTTRVREQLDRLKRTVAADRASTELVSARIAEIAALAHFPREFYAIARISAPIITVPRRSKYLVDLAARANWKDFLDLYGDWRNNWEASLPNLLTPQEAQRQGRLLVKLLRLVPKEYHNGVRDGQVVVPLEYREAKDFIVQAQQLVDELSGAWRQANQVVFDNNAGPLTAQLEEAERLISTRADESKVEAATEAAGKILEKAFGLGAKTLASGKGAVEETALEVRTALKDSLAAAQAGRWTEAESLRVDAYTTFDTDLEKRVLPRDPELALRAERSFLDGEHDQPGIKALFDQRKKGRPLEAAFARTLAAVDDCTALLKVTLSPATVIYTVLAICAREGLEAVIVLAALLAGMRGHENQRTRRRVVSGAWLALAATALTFWLSRTLIQSLSRFGEKLEAVISVLAVLVLLMVTNWVFHKVYWVGWNAKLRKMSKSADRGGESRLEWLSLVMVGFLTIYREGFETTLFLQSLILESGMKWVLVGILCGAVMVGTAGLLIFVIGARLPYRKLLVLTGVLVVTILVTFLGSTVRLFQTVGWLPIHPLPDLHLPAWAGFWFGLYPSVEGVAIPLLGFVYVGSAWLFVKWQSHRRGARAMKATQQIHTYTAHPALAERTITR